MTESPPENTARPGGYADYLSLSTILTSQHRRSVLYEEPVHDETLFIVIHQTIELWFLQIIVELKAAIEALRENRLGEACDDIVRVSRIFAVLTLSWDVLATLRVREFWNFRRHFLKDRASGLQSKQFREIEFLLGVGPGASHDEVGGRSLWDEVNLWLGARGLALPDEIQRRDFSQAYPHVTEDEDGNIYGEPIIEEKWFEIYSEPSDNRDLYQLGERLLDLSSAVSAWRSKHITTVQRYIGDLGGSGGTEGVRYLRKTLRKRAFPELWSVRNKFEDWIKAEHPADGNNPR